MMKKFLLHWLDGNVSCVEGNSIEEAFRNAGYGGGAVRALDWHEEAKELPIKYKEVILLEPGKRHELGILSQDTQIIRQLKEQLESGRMDGIVLGVVGNEWIVDASIKPMEIVLTTTRRKYRNGEIEEFTKESYK